MDLFLSITWCFPFLMLIHLFLCCYGQPMEVADDCIAATQDCHNTHTSNLNSPEYIKYSLPNPGTVYRTKNNTAVYVFDDVFSLSSLVVMERYNEIAARWRYRISNENGLAPWTAPLNTNKMSSTHIGKRLRQLVIAVTGKTDIKMSNVELNIIRRQDPIKVSFDSDTVGSMFTAVLYMNPIWRKNDYGDAIFYERGQDIALASIKPKYGRLLLFDSTIGYLPRPPSVNYRAGQVSLVVRFSSNETQVKEMQVAFEAEVEAKKQNTKDLFHNMSSKSITKMDVEKYLVKKYESANGRQIFVFDDLFADEDLEKIQHHVLNYGDFYYDDSFDFESDNVVWIAAFSVDDFVSSRMWPVVQKVASFTSGKDSWFPYDIACNVIRNADSTRVHEDCEENEEEWTFLLYLNSDWSSDYYGETAFFENKDDDSEVIATVLPKYGRAVIFEGIIPHSARPPSSSFNGTRLSFAVKLSINEKVGRSKLFLQSFNHELELHKFMLNILTNHDQPDFVSSFKKSLIAQINEQRNVDWNLAKYSFQGVTTEDNMKYVGDNDIYEEDEEDFPVVTEREEYINGLLKKFADDTETLKEHFEEFEKDHSKYYNDYIEKILNIL